MKKKNIIIVSLCALLLAGAAVGAVYFFDGGVSSEVKAPEVKTPETKATEVGAETGVTDPDKPAVLAKDDPSIAVDISDIDMTRPHAERRKTYKVEHARVRSVIDEAVADALAENPGIENIGIGEDECMDMTKEQIKLYVDLIVKMGNEKNGVLFGSYRLCSQAKGEIPLDAPRLTVEAFDEIMSQSSSFDEACIKIGDQYGGPDYFTHCSGVSGGCWEYWLNDDGSKSIGYSWYWDEEGISLRDGDDVTVLYTNDDLKALFGKE